MSDTTTSWSERVKVAYQDTHTLLNSTYYWQHPLTGYTRAGQALGVLVTELERLACVGGPEGPPWAVVWDARTIRDAVEVLAPAGEVDRLISDARYVVATSMNDTSHTTSWKDKA